MAKGTTDYPASVVINEEGPREGFQIEKAPISTVDKVRFIEALAETGLKKIDCVSFVNPKRVPQMADSEVVAATIKKSPPITRGMLAIVTLWTSFLISV